MIRLKGYEATRKRIYVRDGGICGMCGGPVAWEDYDLDHRVPRYLGGDNTDANLRVAHKACNRRAGQRLRQPGITALPSARMGRWR